jgi:hypothetical protein
MRSEDAGGVSNYRALVLARIGTVLESHQFAASNDSAALHRARDYLTSQEVEVWHANRLVGLLKPSEHVT